MGLVVHDGKRMAAKAQDALVGGVIRDVILSPALGACDQLHAPILSPRGGKVRVERLWVAGCLDA